MRARKLFALAAGLLLSLSATAQESPQSALAARGKAVFEHRCGMCHRERETGTFTLARRLGADRALLEARTDLAPVYIRTVVRWGLVNMPRISRVEVPDDDLNAVVAYLTTPKSAVAATP